MLKSSFLSPDAVPYSGAFFGAGTGPIHLDDVRCSGSEAALINCTYDPSTVDCSHREDAGVLCQSKKTFILSRIDYIM